MVVNNTSRRRQPVAPLAASTAEVMDRLRAMQAEIHSITDPEAPTTGAPRPDAAARVLTIDQVAARLGISRSDAHRRVQRGEIAGFRVGRLWRVREEVVERFIHDGEAAAARERRRVG